MRAGTAVCWGDPAADGFRACGWFDNWVTSGDVKILLTAGAGDVGSVCVAESLDAGNQVCVIGNLSEARRLRAVPRRTGTDFPSVLVGVPA